MLKLITNIKIVLVLAVFSTNILWAQTKDNPWSINAGIGLQEYSGDLGFGFFKFRMLSDKGHTNQPGVGYIGVTRYFNQHFNFNANYTHGEWGYKDYSSQRYFYTVSKSLSAIVNWKFLENDDSKLVPFFYSGLAYRNLGSTKSHEINIPLGIGAQYKLTDKFAIVAQTGFVQTFNDKGDLQNNNNVDVAWMHKIGIGFMLGKQKDSDGDGIVDSKDKCDNTPKKALIDKNGCILDIDKDGIADNLDDCPYDFGIEKFGGCPDKDGDDIPDSEDKCPEVAGVKQFNGCPDTDGDGIQDSEDKCIDVKGLKQFGGCPDTDGDGIEDAKDKCPTIKGVALFAGCPDTDGDGVEDAEDKCPNLAGTIANKGCPELNKEEKKILADALAGVMFETNSAKIRTVSFPKLDNVVKVMLAHKNYKLLIEGHTDNDGKPEDNLQLSKDRAKAVKEYLIKKGVDAGRLISDGYGETKPIADNNTNAGKLKNRRVEFSIIQE